mgnify:CR=1 FL=1
MAQSLADWLRSRKYHSVKVRNGFRHVSNRSCERKRSFWLSINPLSSTHAFQLILAFLWGTCLHSCELQHYALLSLSEAMAVLAWERSRAGDSSLTRCSRRQVLDMIVCCFTQRTLPLAQAMKVSTRTDALLSWWQVVCLIL